MSLRLKLLLLGLATLVLPWGGCNYAREMELALREGEQNSLQAVSQTMAASLQGRTDLLYRETDDSAGAQSTAASEPAPAAGADRVKPGAYDLKPLALPAAPLVDGYPDDWPNNPAAWAYFKKDEEHRFGILTGVYERMLYVLLEVHDEHPVYDAPSTNALDPATFGDRVWLGFQDSDGEESQLFLAATGPGAPPPPPPDAPPDRARSPRAASRPASTASRARCQNRACAPPGSRAARATASRSACRCRWSAAASAF